MEKAALQLRKLMETYGITQVKLAEELGISPVAVSKQLNGNPKQATVKKAVEAINRLVAKQRHEAEDGLSKIKGFLEEPGEVYASDRGFIKKQAFMEQLRLLSDLYRDKLLSEEEFQKAKDILLKEL